MRDAGVSRATITAECHAGSGGSTKTVPSQADCSLSLKVCSTFPVAADARHMRPLGRAAKTMASSPSAVGPIKTPPKAPDRGCDPTGQTRLLAWDNGSVSALAAVDCQG